MSIRKVDNNIWIVTHCPKCGQKNSVGVVAFSDAIDRQDSIVCAACKVRFYVVISLLDPRSPTLRTPVQSEQKCPSCFGRGWLKGQGMMNKCNVCDGTGISPRSDGG